MCIILQKEWQSSELWQQKSFLVWNKDVCIFYMVNLGQKHGLNIALSLHNWANSSTLLPEVGEKASLSPSSSMAKPKGASNPSSVVHPCFLTCWPSFYTLSTCLYLHNKGFFLNNDWGQLRKSIRYIITIKQKLSRSSHLIKFLPNHSDCLIHWW